ncbi:PQQ-dependent sugar dehydrogenase [Rhodococcoides kyotonense]|uniref:Glucose/arabinose dehydrogenase, beta-propeller fold n=1 Tax=Rhodococcoides kyotonense TaxID=398843 RepID=A0A239M5Q0_9NOCA|nr:PQQ-dependent sugar dehydrogenase [Rhodococcus kyotonensis]SNT38045.1 Glucose/arabinose dehydrogenase, beta-propeller fold [Rhodococcus kyotonensis]
MNKLLAGTGVLAASVCLTLACTSGAGAQPETDLPDLQVTTEIDGLNKPWDVVVAPDGTILTGERSGRFVVKRTDGSVADLAADLSDLYAQGETGLMGIELAQDFSESRALYTCQGVTGGGGLGTGSAIPGSAGGDGNHIAVFRWTVDPEWTTLTRTQTVVDDIPVAASGRHGGCRILSAPDGSLFVGTGDTASPTVPQDRNSLGGKVLHVNADGTAAADAPGRVYTLGHRNVQGLAFQPGTDRLYEVEQGTTRDDELNLLVPGGNYGYKPDRNPLTYDESVPMTDPERVPGAIEAVWSSGEPTIATPDLTFVDGAAWGDWSGAAVISSQQGQKLVILKLTEDGTGVARETVALEGEYGRLRSMEPLADGSFLLTTDNGSGDRVLRVTPSS